MAIYDILMAYGATPRTGVTPYRAMSNRPIHTTTKLERNKQHEMMEETGMLYKGKMKRSDLSIKEHNFMVGDYALLKRKNTSKWSTVHEPVFYTVINVSGSSITGRRVTDGGTICGDWSHFKLANVTHA